MTDTLATPRPAGQTTLRRLTARRKTLDFRDRMFQTSLVEVPTHIPLTDYLAWGIPVLDQGGEGACTGFGLATVANYPLRRRKVVPDIAWPMPPAGGHAFAIVAYDADGFWIQNSWDDPWGRQGLARISYDDWLANATDVWLARLGEPVAQFQSHSSGSSLRGTREAIERGSRDARA